MNSCFLLWFSSDCEKSVLFSTENCGLAEEILTIPTSPRAKSISCQTTSDLHVSLLKQEFPHLFNQQSNGVGMYDTLDKSTPTDFKACDDLKTPQISGTSRHISFTTISSVTSSEKKIFENLFTDRSVLDDSSFHCASVAEKTLDMIQPLPSTGKKAFPASTSFTCEKPYPIGLVTLELDPDVNFEKQKMIDNHMCTASSTPHSQTKAIYCSSVNTMLHKSEMDESILKRVANESNKAEYVDSGHKNDQFGSTAIKKISGELNSDNVVVVPDQNVILNEFFMAQSTGRISPKAVASRLDQNLKSSYKATSVNNDASDNGTTPVVSIFSLYLRGSFRK